MLMLKPLSHTHQISSIPLTNQIQKPHSILKVPLFHYLPIQTYSFSHVQLKSRTKNLKGFKVSSDESNSNGGSSGGDEVPRISLKWSELLLDPDRNNVVAVVLSGALAWASAHVLWHLFVVTMAVLMAAIKYTIVGVFLIFILITLL